MSYSIIYSEKALKQLEKLSKHLGIRILSKIDSIVEDPHHYLESCEGYPYYHQRVGNFRVIHGINERDRTIEVLKMLFGKMYTTDTSSNSKGFHSLFPDLNEHIQRYLLRVFSIMRYGQKNKLLGIVIYSDWSGKGIKKSIAILNILKNGICTVSCVSISKYRLVNSFSRVPVKAQNFPATW